MSEQPLLRIAIVGVGLIGGSLARALKAAGAVREVVGVARTMTSLNRALELGVIDRAETRLSRIGPVDIVVIATPVRAIPDIFEELAPTLGDETIVTDAGSVKQYVCEASARHLGAGRARFVPGHPIAGTERSGVDASFPALFENRTVILTPDDEVSAGAVTAVTQMWRRTGAEVVTMDPLQHDALLAATSHLPHMVAYTLVNCLAEHPRHEDLFRLAAGGFYDFTRIASSDPVMWRDIALTNSGPLIEAMKTFRQSLDALIQALEAGDEEALYRTFYNAKQARDLGLARKNGDQ
jgi:prephenate dehydrogenase